MTKQNSRWNKGRRTVTEVCQYTEERRIVQTPVSVSVMQQIRDQQRLEGEGEKINRTRFIMIFYIFLKYQVHRVPNGNAVVSHIGKNALDKLVMQ